jgi:release factor glutamine methyltransferase
MTISEASAYSREQLKLIYDEGEAGAISDWLMEHLAGIKKTDRISEQKRGLTEEEVSRLGSYLKRLLTHEPVQYVLNEAWFCGLKFYVDKNVLIPRPETEELIEWIISDCKFPVDQLKILDIGSGSGCIPVSLKRRIGKAEVWGCDISDSALEVATRNATTLGADVRFIQLDFLAKEQRDPLPQFDVIVSNPPYVPEKDKDQMQPNVRDHEPAVALFVPDNDPLVFYRAIADFGKKHLNPGGTIYTEIYENLGAETLELFVSNGYKSTIKKDITGKERMMKAILSS